jgi:hypothetical protein
MKIFKLLSLPLILFLLLACSSEKSPGQVYEEYNSRAIQGINYDDDMAYYTKRKQEEVIKVYIEFSRALAKCKEITLVKEVVDLNTAVLEYSQKDICGNESTSQEKLSIQMINEGGWKIDDIEISL